MPQRRSKVQAKAKARTATAPKRSRLDLITTGVLGVVILFMDFSIRVRSAINKSVDFQVLIKVGVWVLAAGWIAVNHKKIIPLLNRVSFAWILLFGWMATTALYSPNPLLTLTSGSSLILMALLWLGAANVLGERRLVEVMFWAMVAFCVASLVLWVLTPALAQKSMRIHGVRIFTNRLQGFTGQPNALGRTAAFAALLGLLYFDYFRQRVKWLAVLPIGVALVTLWFTQSRTSAVALVMAATFFYAVRSRRRWVLPALAVAVAAAALFVIPNFDNLALLIARSGDATEIYTATNRIYIWSLVGWMILQRPLLGWGYNTAAYHLAAYSKQVSPELGNYVPPNAHNAYLEVAFAGGAVAALLFLAAAAANLLALLKHRHQRGLALMLFWFVTSFTEVAGFTGVVSTSTITMILPMALAALAESRVGATRPRRKAAQEPVPAPAPASGSAEPTVLDIAADDEPPPPKGAPGRGVIDIHDIG